MPRTSQNYYIAPSAISIILNANGMENDIAVSISEGAKIKVYYPEIPALQTYYATYRAWTLTGRNRRLADSTKPYTIYARLSKADETAYLVFAQKILVDGKWVDPYVLSPNVSSTSSIETIDANGKKIVWPPIPVAQTENNRQDYWWVKLGDIGIASGGMRTADIDTGILGTDQFNTEFEVNPDNLPVRIVLKCAIEGEDAGSTPYVYWGKSVLLSASLVEGWEDTEVERFDHWEITRNSGDPDADADWLSEERASAFGESGEISLSHARGVGDDFNGAVSSTFTVVAWGRENGDDSSDSSSEPEPAELVQIASASINIMAETVEKYELVLSTDIVSYDPRSERYTPDDGVEVRILATDQRGYAFKLTRGQFVNASLVAEYSRVGTDAWFPMEFYGGQDEEAVAYIRNNIFATYQSVNVRLIRVLGTEEERSYSELSRNTIAFVRDGEDSKEREWIYRLNSSEGYDNTAENRGKQFQDDDFVPIGWTDDPVGVAAPGDTEYASWRDYDRNAGEWGLFNSPVEWAHRGEDGPGPEEFYQYSVDFGAYVDVITVDDVGNVIGGLYRIDPDTQEKYDFRINSAMQVRKNGTLLTKAADDEDVGEGTFKIYAEPVGCTCEIRNTTIYITSITGVKDGVAGSDDDDEFDYDAMREKRNCYVNLLFDCEGRTTFSKQFPVTIEHDSEPFVGADLDNEHSGISWITRTRSYVGVPFDFNMKLWHNNELLEVANAGDIQLTSGTDGVVLDGRNVPAPYPNVICYSREVVNGVARIRIRAVGSDVPAIVNINVTCSVEYAGIRYERTLVHTITKSTDTNVYSLLPDPTEVVTNGTSLSTNSVNCSVICDSSDDEHYNVPYADFSRHNIILVYRKYYTDGTSDVSDTEYRGSAVAIDSSVQRIVWSLYGLSGGSIDRSVLHDSEGVPVLANGIDGEGVEYIFITQNTETPKPTIYDDPDERQQPDYQPYTDAEQTARWDDEPIGTGANNRFEFYAQRKKVDGLWQPFGDVKIWNRYTESGQSPYVIDLSNEQSFVPVNANGNPTGAYETSDLMLFKGTQVAFSEFIQIRIIPTNISCNGYSSAFNLTTAQITAAQTAGYFRLTPSAMTAQAAQIAVQATATVGTVLTTVYTINKAPKDGLVYSLIPTLNVIHKNNDGTYRDTRLTVQVNKIFGSTVTQMTTLAQLSAEGLALTYQYEGSGEFTPSSMINLNTRDLCGTGLYTLLHLRRVSDNVLLDSERINVVSDGDDGEDGADGADGADAHEVNPNILLRTVFDKTLDFIREKWETNNAAYWGNEIHISTSASTMVEGRHSIRINASSLSTFASFQQNVYGRVRAGEWYTLSFRYFFASGGTFDTYIYSGASGSECIDTTAGIYIDGVYVEPGNVHAACQVTWQNEWLGKRHSVTFKMASSLPTTTVNIIFRALPGATVCICMPKLEDGQYPTAYMANEDDLVGEKGEQGEQGEQGLSGCHERLFEVFVPGQYYYNQEEDTTPGIRYVDFLAVEDNSYESGYKVYMCLDTHQAAATFEQDLSHWSEVSINAASAFFKWLIAKNANIRILTSAQFSIADTNGNVVAGFANTEVPLFVGGSVPSSAPFRVTRAGKLYATGCVISGDSQFEGTLNGVEGSFKTLNCVNTAGDVVGRITFGTLGNITIEGDLYSQGPTTANRPARYYASEIFCRGMFGARQRLVLVVTGTDAYFFSTEYLSRWDVSKAVHVSLESATTTGGDTYYKVPCFGDTGNAAGMPVDTVLFRIESNTTYRYVLSSMPSQRVFVANINDNYNNVIIICNGREITWNGGDVSYVQDVGFGVMLPAKTSNVLGAGQLVGPFRDNDWA